MGDRALAAVALAALALAPTACSASGDAQRPPTPARSAATSASATGAEPATGAGRSADDAPSPALVPARAASADVGSVRSVVIPGTVSRFAARPAEVYLPPVLRAAVPPPLPVLELLHGTPGSPADWVRRGQVQASMDAFAATHNGLTPIVVMPDINGAERADTECVRDRAGADLETYLTVDVPRWVRAHFATLPAPRGWAIGGLSEGGTCSLMLALRSTGRYSTVADLSGLSRPTVGDRDDPAATVRDLFGGSRRAFDEHDPVYLLHHHRYPATGVWLECGAADTVTLAAQRVVVAAARGAGLSVQARVVPGGHVWTVWAAALRQFLPWLWQRTT